MSVQKRPARPQRMKKADRLLHRQQSADEIRCDYALGPFDRKVREMDRIWGVDRLPELVEPEMAAKFGQAMAKMNAAIEANDPDEVALRASVCVRGLDAMHQRATERGARAPSLDLWIIEADGVEFGLMREPRAWQQLKDMYPDVRLVTEREMVLALKMYDQSVVGEFVKVAQESFPGAEVTKVKLKEREDDIPF